MGRDLSNKNMVHIKKEKTEYLQFRKLLDYKDITHCFSMKIDFGSNDTYMNKKQEFNKSYELICNDLGLDINNTVRPYQTHTDIVKKVEKQVGIFHSQLQNVDGVITDTKGLVLSLSYADCIPIYMYDPVENVIGNIHSGWKGTLQQICRQAVFKLKEEYNCNPSDLICCIGPSICMKHFEVDEDIAKDFSDSFKFLNKSEKIIQEIGIIDEKPKYVVDTVLINRLVLENLGVRPENIVESNICTVCNSNYLHSYRKDKENAGRNTAIISLK